MTKHFPAGIFLLTGLVLSLGPCPLHASQPVDVQWLDLCRATQNQRLSIITDSGAVVEGYCLNVNQNEMRINSREKGIVKLARGSLKRVFVRSGRRDHELANLHHDLHRALRHEVNDLFTEAGPLALVAIPPTLVWGAITVPFCALGDLKHKLEKVSEIRVI